MHLTSDELAILEEASDRTCRLLKTMSHKDRFLILCYLAYCEHNVSDLEATLQLRQPTLSQQLARLRSEKLVKTRRAGKSIYYSLASEDVRQVLRLLHALNYHCRQRTGTMSGGRLATAGS